MEQITNLYELKEKLKNVDFEQCLKIIKNYELVGSSESLDDYIEYILPLQLLTESQSNEYGRKMSAKASAIIDKWKSSGNESDFKNIQIKVKEEIKNVKY